MSAQPIPFPQKKWVSVGAAARYYLVTVQTINNWCKNGTLVSVGCRIVRTPTRQWRILLPE
jgi:hypothetical protein